jgi:hypothetical protein
VMDGDTIVAVNSCETYFVAGETAGVKALDQMQRITGSVTPSVFDRASASIQGTGALRDGGNITSMVYSSGSTGNARPLIFNSADSPNARTSAVTSGATKVKRTAVTYFLRVA